MTHLLDAQTLIWSQDDPTRLGAAAQKTLQDPANVLGIGVAKIWEIGIKIGIGKLKLTKPFRQWIETAIADLGLRIVSIEVDHIERQIAMPLHHRDPFDRLLIAQSLVLGLPVVSNDIAFDAYGVVRIWS